MTDHYLQKVLERGQELVLLNRAAAVTPSLSPLLRVAAAALVGLLVLFLPLTSAGEGLIPLFIM